MPEASSLSHSPCSKWNKVRRIDDDDNRKGARLHRPEQNNHLLSVHVTQALHQPEKLWRYTSPFEQARALKAEQEELSKKR